MKKLFAVKFSVKTMAYMALLLAMTVVLTYVDSFVPSMPQGGDWISFAVIPIILTSYLMGVGYGVIVGSLGAVLQFVLGMAQYYGCLLYTSQTLFMLLLCIPDTSPQQFARITLFLEFSSHPQAVDINITRRMHRRPRLFRRQILDKALPS